MENISLKLVENQDWKTALKLLEKHQLPTADIGANVALYGVFQGSSLIGTMGLEAHNTEGLLRSVCLDSGFQNKGLGTIILKKIEEKIAQQGIQKIYLLTTTAKAFFEKNQYTVISRADVSDALKQTTEFTSTCPSSAIVMLKYL